MATIRVKSGEIYGTGTSRSDKIYGNNGVNILVGDKGDDALWGNGGADLIGGYDGKDKIYGGSGNDILVGGRGIDILSGGSGQDAFVFDAKLRSSEIDTISDFSVKSDSIWLAKSIFAKLGKVNTMLKANAFWTGAEAHDANDRIIYNKDTGALYYDPDGTGAKAAVQFAQLKAGLKMTYKDFFVI